MVHLKDQLARSPPFLVEEHSYSSSPKPAFGPSKSNSAVDNTPWPHKVYRSVQVPRLIRIYINRLEAIASSLRIHFSASKESRRAQIEHRPKDALERGHGDREETAETQPVFWIASSVK